MPVLWLKAFHIIGVVTWLGGLFYLPRLFVYHAEAREAPIRARRLLETLIEKESEGPGFVYRPALMIEDVTPELEMS